MWICLENIKQNDIITNTPSNYIFHFDCFKEYMFVTTHIYCPLCKFDFFSILNGKEIDFNNINTQNNNLNNIKTEKCFINNLPSQGSNVNKKEINIKNTIRKFLFLVLLLLKIKEMKIMMKMRMKLLLLIETLYKMIK